MNKLRLGPLPKTEPVKVTVVLSVRLKTDLDHYATLHAKAHGEAVDAAVLIPHMLESFIARDRVFQRSRKHVERTSQELSNS